MVITLTILIEHGLVSCEGDLGVFRGGSLVIHVTLTHGGYLYRFVLSVPVVWVRKLGVFLRMMTTYVVVEGIMRCLSRDVTVMLQQCGDVANLYYRYSAA